MFLPNLMPIDTSVPGEKNFWIEASSLNGDFNDVHWGGIFSSIRFCRDQNLMPGMFP
jgi:hypothetical protein